MYRDSLPNVRSRLRQPAASAHAATSRWRAVSLVCLLAGSSALAGCGAVSPAVPSGAATEASTEATEKVTAAAAAKAIDAAVAHPDRPANDRARDSDRKPAAVLRFFDIRPGMRVADMMSGRGYYAELLARVVGPTGMVYVHNSPFVLKKFAEGPISKRLARPGLGHTRRLNNSLEDPGLPQGKLDAVLMVLFYHDTYWMKVNRAQMLAKVFASLRPGGVFGVADHSAVAGAGESVVKTLHRVEQQLVEREILAAGFVLDARSEVLRHPADTRGVNVFDASIRGKTDRFVVRFRKPVQ